MKRYALAVLVGILFVSQGFCQESASSSDKDLSIYGEVKSVNIAENSIVVEYYDYDSNAEKTIDIATDNNTKLDGILSINYIKQGNWADIDYAVVNGKNMAKSISVEKEEDTAAATPAP